MDSDGRALTVCVVAIGLFLIYLVPLVLAKTPSNKSIQITITESDVKGLF